MGPLVRKLLVAPGGDARGANKHVNAEKGRGDRKSHNEDTHPINVSLLLGEAEMGQTLVLDLPQEIVLEERLDPCVLVRLVVGILLPQPLHALLAQQTGREVRGANSWSRFLGVICIGGERRRVGGIVRDFLSLGLRRTRSGAAFSIHNEISGGEEAVLWVTREMMDSFTRIV